MVLGLQSIVIVTCSGFPFILRNVSSKVQTESQLGPLLLI